MNQRAIWAIVAALPLIISAKPLTSDQCLAPDDLMRWVPGGDTVIGDNDGYANERPAYRAPVDGFWIDRTEVTNEAFGAFVSATGHVTTAEARGDSIVFSPPAPGERPTSPERWWRVVKGADWRHPSGSKSGIVGHGDDPVVHVSYRDAQAYAHWKGRRLPNEEEYERAAQGGAGPDTAQPSPDNANTWQGVFPHQNIKSDGRSGIAPVGCYKPNRYGAYDLIGNVWEWTASPYLPGHGPRPAPVTAGQGQSYDPRQPGVEVRVIKGGSFLCAPNYCARYRPAARHAQAEEETASHLGFRTAASQKSAG